MMIKNFEGEPLGEFWEEAVRLNRELDLAYDVVKQPAKTQKEDWERWLNHCKTQVFMNSHSNARRIEVK